MADRHVISLLTTVVLLLAVLRLGWRLQRMRRLLRQGGARDDGDRPQRVLDVLTAAFAGSLLAGVVVGLLTRSAAWGAATVAILAVTLLFVAVAAMVVTAVRSSRRE